MQDRLQKRRIVRLKQQDCSAKTEDRLPEKQDCSAKKQNVLL
jgi:hypothetical protein